MRPEKKASFVYIPITFDGAYRVKALSKDKFLISGLLIFLWLVTSIVSIFTGSMSTKLLYPIVSFLVLMLVVRVFLMREYYFGKKRRELADKNFKYDYNVFWNIYEVSAGYPHICRYVNGLKSIFVVFDKDVIVGREEDNDFYHYEAIAEAYNQMAKRGIDCMHIDYMDTVGKDERMISLFDKANKTENADLREVILRIFDNVEGTMQRAYASYDVYCFFFNGREDLFWDELQVVLSCFREANYIRARVLGKEDISELVKSVFNIDKFSVNESSEQLFTDMGETAYIRPIWIERNNERKILNKTREEIEDAQKIVSIEREFKKGNKRRLDKSNKFVKELDDNEEIDLFSEDSDITDSYDNNRDS